MINYVKYWDYCATLLCIFLFPHNSWCVSRTMCTMVVASGLVPLPWYSPFRENCERCSSVLLTMQFKLFPGNYSSKINMLLYLAGMLTKKWKVSILASFIIRVKPWLILENIQYSHRPTFPETDKNQKYILIK